MTVLRLRGGGEDWRMPPAFGWRTVVLVVLAVAVLGWTGGRLEMDRAAVMTGEAVAAAAGAPVDSQVARGIGSLASQLWPPVLAERTEIARIADFDPARLPLFAYVETEDFVERRLDPVSLQMVDAPVRRDVLVEPFGYVVKVAIKLLETVEIALWGTLLGVVLGFPLAVLGASGMTPHPAFRVASRGVVALLRAIPELILALFLVLAFGFGPIAGVLALALHGAGFLGKFYAEDMENADKAPQEALEALGANRLKVLRYAVMPQVLPQYVAYTLYVLDRNVRMATVIGLVGAGGVGQELKGRYDLYQYGHVATVLIAIFLLVFVLDHVSSRIRKTLL
jgi:phosphonate transport system permease protein